MSDINEMFAKMMNISVSATARQIPLSELIGTCHTETPGIGHDKCHSHGFQSMLPAQDGRWVCPACEGYASERDAIVKCAEGVDGFKAMMRRLREECAS